MTAKEALVGTISYTGLAMRGLLFMLTNNLLQGRGGGATTGDSWIASF